MTKFIIRRTLGLIPLLIGVVIISFLLMKAAPGGPQAQFQGNKRITQEQIDAWLKRWCLQPTDANTAITQQVGNYFIEFGGWFGILNCERDGAQAFFSNQGGLNILPAALGGGSNGVIHGDLGYGIQSGRPVTELIAERHPRHLDPGRDRPRPVDLDRDPARRLCRRPSLFAVRPDGDLLQLYLLLAADVLARPEPDLHLRRRVALVPERRDHHDPQLAPVRHAPVLGGVRAAPGQAIADIGWHLCLPVLILVAVNIAGDSRFVRASMLESINQDYVRTAKAKGLEVRVVIGKHAFRNAMLPVVTNVALEIPFLFSGAIVTEQIFSWPGMGSLFITSINGRDYFVIMGLLLVTAVITLFANLLADVVYAIVDPRIRYD